jgi:hypothetical protein
MRQPEVGRRRLMSRLKCGMECVSTNFGRVTGFSPDVARCIYVASVIALCLLGRQRGRVGTEKKELELCHPAALRLSDVCQRYSMIYVTFDSNIYWACFHYRVLVIHRHARMTQSRRHLSRASANHGSAVFIYLHYYDCDFIIAATFFVTPYHSIP